MTHIFQTSANDGVYQILNAGLIKNLRYEKRSFLGAILETCYNCLQNSLLQMVAETVDRNAVHEIAMGSLIILILLLGL